MEWEPEIKDSGFLPKKGKPTEETVYYKLGGTYYEVDDIIYCEIINRKIFLHLSQKEAIDCYDKIENLEKKLDGRFFKCHRSYLVNLKYLKSYTYSELLPLQRLLLVIILLHYNIHSVLE